MIHRVSPARPLTLIALAAAVTAGLAGCGGSETKTVSVAGSPSASGTATTQPSTSTAKTAPTTTGTTATTTPSETTSTSSTTRTATAPAFTETEKSSSGGTSSEGLPAALALVRAHGYTAKDTSDYHPNQTLRVLIGADATSGQQAFFFVDGRYIGTDTKQPSAQISVSSQGDTEVTLTYTLSDGRQTSVPFQLNNGKLTPLAPIPPASSRQ